MPQQITACFLLVMKIEIFNRFTPDGKEFYQWRLWDGPDGNEGVRGYATDLITAFSKVLEWHERIAADYAAEVIADLETLKKFTTNNEID
jgi:hypothetical protein